MCSTTATFLPVLVRPPGTSLLAAATPVPVCAATGHLALHTLRRYFPAATGLVFLAPDGRHVQVPSAVSPAGQEYLMIGDPTYDFIATSFGYLHQPALDATLGTGGTGRLVLEDTGLEARLEGLATALQGMKDMEERRTKEQEDMEAAKLNETKIKMKAMSMEFEIKMKACNAAEVEKFRGEMGEGKKVWKEVVEELIMVKKKVAEVGQVREELEGVGKLRREVEDVRLLRREVAVVKELVQAMEASLHSRVEELQPPGASLEGVMAEVAALTAELEQVVGLTFDIAAMKAELLGIREEVEEVVERARTRAQVLREETKEIKDQLSAMQETVQSFKVENDVSKKEKDPVVEGNNVKQEEGKREKINEKVDEGGDSKDSGKSATVEEKDDDLAFDFVSVKPRLVRKVK